MIEFAPLVIPGISSMGIIAVYVKLTRLIDGNEVLKNQVGKTDTDLKAQIGKVDNDLKAQIGKVDNDVGALKKEYVELIRLIDAHEATREQVQDLKSEIIFVKNTCMQRAEVMEMLKRIEQNLEIGRLKDTLHANRLEVSKTLPGGTTYSGTTQD